MTGKRSPWLFALAFLLQPSLAGAQGAPFDMSPERPSGTGQLPSLPETMEDGSRPSPPGQVKKGEGTTTGNRRFILPFQELSLGGEYNRRVWSIYVTAEQAKNATSVTLTYQNAIMVAPEWSALSLLINDRQVGQEPVSSPNGNKAVRWDLPAALLKPGLNAFELVVDQRHRTDCDVQSTYDLWTNIDGKGSYLDFAARPDVPSSPVEAARAIGADGQGLTHFEMVVPSLSTTPAMSPALRIAQALAILSGMPNTRFEFHRSIPESESGSGRLTVLIGTTAELASLLPDLPPVAQTASLITVMPAGADRKPAIVVTGPTWLDIQHSLDAMLAPISQSSTDSARRRESIATERWASPNPAFLLGGEVKSFAQLGVHTVEFTGRRYRTAFDVAVPSDFYAGAYGEAVITLDAAHGNLIDGTSRLNIFVNGNFAATMPLTGQHGGVLEQIPIRLTLRHFRPGTNHIEIEAVTVTEADEACLPDRNGSSAARFALFDSSSFTMPRFARMGQTPNLAALAGTGFPYSRQSQTTSLFLPRTDADTLSAAANVLGKVAQVAGALIEVEPVLATSMIADRDAIFIAEAGQLPVNVLTQLNLDPDLASRWRGVPGMAPPGSENPAMEAWRDRVEDGFLVESINSGRAWIREKLNMAPGALRFFPEAESPFVPATSSELAIVQGLGPTGKGIWTVVTAPTTEVLTQVSSKLVQQHVWEKLSGRTSAISQSTEEIVTTEVLRPTFRQTLAPSLANYRLIAANWLSSHLLSYALVLALVSCLLGIATAALLPWIGRKR